MEPIIALVVCFGVAIALWIYKRWFFAEGAREPEFEAWCATRPLVLALRRPGGALDLSHVVRPLVTPGTYANRSGVFPWQHYLVWVEERRVDGDVLGLYVTGCRPRKERDEAAQLDALVDAIARTAGAGTEVWIHGQLHASPSRTGFDRNRVSWLGEVGEDGALEVRESLAPPAWVRGKPAAAA